jgi:hypothetical protein
MSNRDQVEAMLGAVLGLLHDADTLQQDVLAGEVDPVGAIKSWKARAGPLWGDVGARVPKLLASLQDEAFQQAQTARLEELRARHARMLRRLDRFEQDVTHATGSAGFEALRQAVLDEVDSLEDRFLELEKSLDIAGIKALEFEGRVSISALERRVGQELKAIELREGLEIKTLMGRLRDFFKGGIGDLRRHLQGELALSARRRFMAPHHGQIPAGFVPGSRPFPANREGKSGLFFEAYPNGQLKVLARMRDGRTERSLFLFNGVAEGQYQTRSEIEYFNSDGTIELCGAMHQTQARPSGMTFHAWATSRALEV